MKVLLTGAGGFLGWHLRCRLQALSTHDITPVLRATWQDVPRLMAGQEAVVHVAGVNRGSPREVGQGNVELAADVARALRQAPDVKVLVYAGSRLQDTDSPYGVGKAQAGELLSAVAGELGIRFVDVRLPNLFGEHARPYYNSFFATFCDQVVRGQPPTVEDRELPLLHAQGAAQLLLEALTSDVSALVRPTAQPHLVSEVLELIRAQDGVYRGGEFPPLDTAFRVDVFNSYRSALFPDRYPLRSTRSTDGRGALTECVRSRGGPGQTFVSTTVPGATRGEHYHLRKVERFLVLRGEAEIRVRRLFDDSVTAFRVRGDDPAPVDMPTMWAHSLTNVGPDELVTLFWTNELFDSESPDTYPAKVEPDRARSGVIGASRS